MKQYLLFIIFALIFITCSHQKEQPIERIVDDFYQTYSQRQNLNHFLQFYDDDIILEDIINGDRIEGKEALKNFLDWDNPDFKLLDSNSLWVSEKIIQGNQAVVKGYLPAFNGERQHLGRCILPQCLPLMKPERSSGRWIGSTIRLIWWITPKGKTQMIGSNEMVTINLWMS